MHNSSGEVLDPDVDVWIPDDPGSDNLGLTVQRGSERLKSYWVAQCCLRGIPVEGGPKDSIRSLQAKMRDRSEAMEQTIAPLKELCEQVLDAEFRRLNPSVRFNIRAVRKARSVMLQPEENTIARNWLTSRAIRPATLARLESNVRRY